MNPLSLLIPVAHAATPCYKLLAPVGTFTSAGCYTLTQYLNGIFTTVIGIAGILAVVMIVICAIRMMTTGSVAGRSEAKECIFNAIFGVLIAIGSWLLLNTINPQLLRNDAEITVAAQDVTGKTDKAAAKTQEQPTATGCYFRYSEISTGNIEYEKSPTGELCEVQRMNARSDENKEVETSCFCNKPGAPGTPIDSEAPPVSSVDGGIKCPLSGLNLCEPQYRQCTNPQCSKLKPRMTASFASMAEDNASHTGLGADGAELIKAIIMQESSCGIQIVGDGGKSCGPMHIKPETANKFLEECDLEQPVTCGWLTEPANFDKAICLSAEYIQSLTDTDCGSDIRNLAAGYNGGPGACEDSESCSGDDSCGGDSPKKWECLYDDAAHKQCNAGYSTTRNYATKVLYCVDNPGAW